MPSKGQVQAEREKDARRAVAITRVDGAVREGLAAGLSAQETADELVQTARAAKK